jgi:hypothetical protein
LKRRFAHGSFWYAQRFAKRQQNGNKKHFP